MTGILARIIDAATPVLREMGHGIEAAWSVLGNNAVQAVVMAVLEWWVGQ